MTTRRPSPPKPERRKTTGEAASRRSAADLQKQLDRRTRELAKTRKLLKEALQQQSATSEVLQVINSSAVELASVFDAMLKRAMRLCEAAFGGLWVFEGDRYVAQALCGVPSAYASYLHNMNLVPGPHTAPYRFLQGERSAIQNVDLSAEESYLTGDPQRRALVDLGGARAALQVPLVRDELVLGVITVYRQEVRPFSEQQVTLLQNFADQAVIAIDNARLFEEVQTKTRDLSEALTYQTGSANILSVIASSPTSVEPVLNAIVRSACELCDAYDAFVRLRNGDNLAFGAHFGPIPVTQDSVPISRGWTAGLAVIEQRPVHIHDLLSADGDEFPEARELGRRENHRTILSVPLVREGESVGAIVLRRTEVHPFSDKQIALLQTFADQAVIAIENARLFNETTEALERQTATSEILKVIAGSPADVQPVFDAIATSANRLVGGLTTAVHSLTDDTLHLVAFTAADPEGDAALRASYPKPLSELPWGEQLRNGEVVQVRDTDIEWTGLPDFRDVARKRGFRSIIRVPMLREGATIGTVSVSRKEPGRFPDNHVQLLQTFADQAVIAIENTRLFNETKEALERQTATADILKVIASSPDNVQPVFQAIADRSKRLVDALSTTVFRLVDGMLHLRAFTPTTLQADARLQASFPAPLSTFSWGEAIAKGEIYRVIDAEQEPERLRELARERGWRSALLVPLLRDGKPIGMIGPTRAEPGPFSEHHVQLMQTFADQAVIAIQNVELFDEVQAKTRDLTEALTYQTGSANILKVIASSPTSVQPVLQAIVETACELCEAYDAVVLLKAGDDLRFSAHHGPIPMSINKWSINRRWTAGRAFVDKRPVHVHDLMAEGDEFPDGRDLSRLMGHRSILSVPLLRENESIGVIVLRRIEVNPFSDKQIALLRTFADQAVIAIGNVRLFDELQHRTRELSKSLDDLRAAQDRLIQTEKLASLGQLTAGIAHEIKNPLNFVNNFAALSIELTDELKGALKPAALDRAIRAEVDEITGLLKDNLGKVVQHGKRADSIVKNMLQHSREGSSERRSADINALVGESLNLAYHGARAERPGFAITLKHDLDPDAGALELYPQEITRALLNLIANGFYAAVGRKAETDDKAYEPVLSATTRNLGETVEIRIRDNGTGIPPDVREKMFNPFFTTKPTGEGTGLGLSMTHDIIVKQHGGRIDVETEPGTFTEFIVTLPRGNGTAAR